ncbi:MAG TPA: hypothetical protein PLH94_04910 [Fimbriimonadaceae bacterium]|nr:hypothetical protein [Fimbriimonadaceae bacterium]
MKTLLPFIALALPAAIAADTPRRWTLDVEGGARWNGLNEAAIPGDGGTRFDLRGLTGSGARLSARFTLTYRTSSGPEWRVLVSPLRLSGVGELDQPVDFEGVRFAPGVPTRGAYRFDSYRVTYRNRFRTRPGSNWRVGATLKLRSAEIGLSQGGLGATKTDLGIVPLLHLFGEERLGGPWSFVFELDGAWAPQGRAIDAAIKLRYAHSEQLATLIGLRLLDGGADNASVYTFARFETLFAGIQFRF